MIRKLIALTAIVTIVALPEAAHASPPLPCMNIMGAPIPPKVQSSISCDFKFPLPYKLPAGY